MLRKIICILFMFICNTVVCAKESQLTYANKQYRLKLIFKPQAKQSYQVLATLYRAQGKALATADFSGCLYAMPKHETTGQYLKERKLLRIQFIPQGVAIYRVVSCGAQVQWRLQVLTPHCQVNLPVTDINGQPITPTYQNGAINYGELSGFGANRQVLHKAFHLINCR